MQIDRSEFTLVWNAVETMSTHEATAYAHEHGVTPPTAERGWTVNMTYDEHGTPALAWCISRSVVIDLAGTNDPYPKQSMEIDTELHARLLAETTDMDDTDAIAAHVRASGVAAPDESPEWEVYVDTVDGRDGERLIWHRSETVPIVPAEPAEAT